MPPKFNSKQCLVPTVWCGKGASPKNKKDYKNNNEYLREGSKEECLQKGFGAGMIIERNKNLSENSLQKIKYVGEVYEANFLKIGINNSDDLLRVSQTKTQEQLSNIIQKAVTKKDRKIDNRAYNHILLWLYQHGISEYRLPACSLIFDV
jgi:hypothetical protein